MRLIDGDALLETVEDHVTAVSCCPTVDWSRGKTQMKKQVIEDIRKAPTVATDINVLNKWISVKDRLPEEKESMFAKFHDTEMLSRAMWLKESETVLVGVAFPDGGQKVTVGKLRDGKWSTTVSQVIPHTVTHWMSLPEPPKEGDRG